MIAIVDKLVNKFIKGDQRTVRASQNILYSLFFKGGSMVVNFLIVSTSLSYISSEKYGVWLTIASIFSWFVLFDFGMGNGLRNKLAEAISKERYDDAKVLVSSTYGFLAIISMVLFAIISIVFPFINWFELLNIDKSLFPNFEITLFVCAYAFILQLNLQLINSILLACHETSKLALLAFIGQLGSLLIILILKSFTVGKVFYLALAITSPSLVGYLVFTYIYFTTTLKKIKPSIKDIDLSSFRKIGDQSWKFFVISISVAILYFSNNIVISYLFGPEEVTIYNVCYKYFNVFIFGFGIIMSPFWSSFTDAYYKEDFDWIKNIIKKLLMVWSVIIVLVFMAVIVSNYFYKFWVGEEIIVPNMLSVLMGIFVIVYTWNSIYLYFLNGVGKITIQLLLHILNIIFCIPLMFLLCNYFHWGLTGVIFSHIMCQLMFSIVAPIQVSKILSNRAIGLWSR